MNTGGKARLRLELLRNNLVACLVHAIVVVIFFAWSMILYMMGLGFVESLTIRTVLVLAFITMPFLAVYTYLGYRHLTPLPKLNFLSVLAPLVIFLMTGTLALTELPAQLLDNSSMYDWQVSPLSNLAAMINFSGNSIVMTSLIPLPALRGIPWVHSIVAFIAAFVPSLLMYLGVRLNIASQTKELNEGE